MACAIVSGYALDCKDTVGGIKTVYITELANVSSVTENASGYVTAITMSGSKKFFTYALEPRGQNNLTQNIQANAQNGTVAYEQTLTLNFVKMKYENQIKFENIIKNRCAVIVLTQDGSYWLCGKTNGMEVTGGSGETGTAMNDFQGYKLTMTVMEKAFANEVSSSVISGIISA